MPDRFRIDGEDLPDGVSVVSYGVLVPSYSGSDVSLPYGVGELPGRRTRKGTDYPLGIRVRSRSLPAHNDLVREAAAFVTRDADLVTLTRLLETDGGTSELHALARYVSGAEFFRRGFYLSEALVRWRLLEGAFFPAEYSAGVAVASGGSQVVTPGGQLATDKVLLTFSGGSGQVLTSSTGYSLALPDVSTAGTAVVVDVGARTALQGATSVKGALVAAGPDFAWLPLTRKAQTLSLSGGGSVTVAWKAAHL